MTDPSGLSPCINASENPYHNARSRAWWVHMYADNFCGGGDGLQCNGVTECSGSWEPLTDCNPSPCKTQEEIEEEIAIAKAIYAAHMAEKENDCGALLNRIKCWVSSDCGALEANTVSAVLTVGVGTDVIAVAINTVQLNKAIEDGDIVAQFTSTVALGGSLVSTALDATTPFTGLAGVILSAAIGSGTQVPSILLRGLRCVT